MACDKSEFRGTLKAFPTEGGLHLNSRKQSLDALRGIAVLMVVASHYSVVLPHRSFLLETGWVGVDLFFVLSGFLISGLLFSEVKASGTINVKRFWIRRDLRYIRRSTL